MELLRLLVPILLLIAAPPAAHAQVSSLPTPNLDLGPMVGGVLSQPRQGRRVSTITVGSSNAAQTLAASLPESRRREAEKAFVELLALYPKVEQALGQRSGDAAVATAVMLIASYEAYRDVDVDEAGVKKVIGQVRRVLESSPGFAGASASKRRLLHESMAILGLFVAAAKANLNEKPDAAAQQNLRTAARGYLALLVGGDPDKVEITSAGLVLQQGPAAGSAPDEVAAAPGTFEHEIHCAVNVSLGRQYDALQESFEEKYERWLLFADGSVYDDLPSGPLTDFDAAAAKKKRPRGWGRYKIKGNSIEVVWNGSADRQPRLYRDWFRLDVPKRGAKLSGHYSRSGFVQQNLGADTSFSASGWSTMSFHKNGKFSQAKGGSTSYGTAGGGVLARDRSETDGTYTIDGPLLVMKHEDGTVFRASLFFVGSDPKIIFVNGAQYMRR